MKEFSLLIKPASADCNLKCAYCFYLDKKDFYPEKARHRMSDDVLEKLIQSYMATDQKVYSFGWQGGEPTLMGRDFFQKVVKYQQKYGKPGSVVANGLQTNATLIDDDIAALIREYKFLVGCSLDGPAKIHNQYRKTLKGNGSHKRVLKGIEMLKKHNVNFNILVLVSQSNVNHAKKVYQYLVDHGFYYHQYIPCVEFDRKGNPLSFSIDGRAWGRFINEIFDQWYSKDTDSVSIRNFDTIMAKMVDGADTICTSGENCCQYFVVEHNGDIYPCDFFVEKKFKLGNVMEKTWEEMVSSKVYQDFGKQKSQWNNHCNDCDCIELCKGDCLKHRTYNNNLPSNLSFLCKGWQAFLRHSRSRFESFAKDIRTHRREEEKHQWK